MNGVRITAAGAVFAASFLVLTAPVRACDDRFLQKCESEAAAALQPETFVQTRRKPYRLRAAAVRPDNKTNRAWHARPSAVTPTSFTRDEQPAPRMGVEPPAVADTVIARRFRGFIDPHPMSVNVFEALRKPRLDSEHLVAAPTMAANDMSAVASGDDTAIEIAPDDVNVEPAPDMPPLPTLVSERSAASRAPVTAPPPAVEARPAATASMPVYAAAASEPPAAPAQPDRFPFHKLVFALCGALGVASALRFIVGA